MRFLEWKKRWNCDFSAVYPVMRRKIGVVEILQWTLHTVKADIKTIETVICFIKTVGFTWFPKEFGTLRVFPRRLNIFY